MRGDYWGQVTRTYMRDAFKRPAWLFMAPQAQSSSTNRNHWK